MTGTTPLPTGPGPDRGRGRQAQAIKIIIPPLPPLENLPSPLFALRARGPMGRRPKRGKERETFAKEVNRRGEITQSITQRPYLKSNLKEQEPWKKNR